MILQDIIHYSPCKAPGNASTWRWAVEVFAPSSVADIPATEQLANGLGRVWQHRSMVQVMGAMPFDDLLLQLRDAQKKSC